MKRTIIIQNSFTLQYEFIERKKKISEEKRSKLKFEVICNRHEALEDSEEYKYKKNKRKSKIGHTYPVRFLHFF